MHLNIKYYVFHYLPHIALKGPDILTSRAAGRMMKRESLSTESATSHPTLLRPCRASLIHLAHTLGLHPVLVYFVLSGLTLLYAPGYCSNFFSVLTILHLFFVKPSDYVLCSIFCILYSPFHIFKLPINIRYHQIQCSHNRYQVSDLMSFCHVMQCGKI